MNERLFLRLPADPREPVRWGLLAPGAEAFADTGSCPPEQLARLAEVAAGRSLVVIVPGTDCLLTSAKVPTKQPRQILKALPYLLEEQLVGDVEVQHFAVGQRRDDGMVPVVVVARSRIEAWLTRLGEAGLSPDALVPDAGLLPAAGATALFDGALALLRLDTFSLFALESELLPDLLALRLGEGDERPAVAVHGASEAQAAELETLLGERAELSFEACYDPLLWLAGHYDGTAINLMQGPYAKRKDRSEAWNHWRPVALVAGLALVVNILALGIESWHLAREKDSLRQEIQQAYSQAFPGEPLPRDIAKTLKSRMSGQATGGSLGFLGLLQKLGEGFAQSTGITPTSLSFESGRGELRLDVNAPDFDALERFRQTLIAQGLSVESGPASDSGSGYNGRLVIRGGE